MNISANHHLPRLSIFIFALGASLLFLGVIGFVGVAVADTEGEVSIQETSPSTSHDDAVSIMSSKEYNIDSTVLQSENKTHDVLVRFPPYQPSSGEVTQSDLRTHATETQNYFIEEYNNHPAVDIQTRFWATNAILITVDTESVPLNALTNSENVVGIHGDTTVTIADSQSETAMSPVDSSPEVTGSSPLSASPWQPTYKTAQTDKHPRETVSTSAAAPTYGVKLIRAPEVWDRFDVRGEGTGIAVIDSGVDPDREDLHVAGWAEFDDHGQQVASTPYDPTGHGTHVAGTVAGNDASGTAIGVAPEASIHAVKAFDENGSATLSGIIAGIEWAIANDDVDIIQMSFGAEGTIEPLVESIINARNAGKLPVASAGNGGTETSSSPGNVYDAVSVGAVDTERTVASFSSGESIETDTDWDWNSVQTSRPEHWPDTYLVPSVTAPGVSVQSARAGDATALTSKSGTSMASPHVSGVAALVWAATDHGLSVDELNTVLRETADHPDGTAPDSRYGTGVVDALTAVETATGEQSTSTELIVSSLDTPDRVTRGESVSVHATVTNTGSVSAERTVEYVFDETVVDSREVAVLPGESSEFLFTRSTGDIASGEYHHSVTTGDDTQTRSIRVDAPGKIEISAFDSSSSVYRGELIASNVTLTNTGDTTVTRNVTYQFNGTVIDKQSVTLAGGNSTTRMFTHESAALESGTYEHIVTTGDDEQHRSIEIKPTSQAAITFDDQRSSGTQVLVSSAVGPDQFVVVLTDDRGNQIGISDEIATEAELFSVPLTERLTHDSANHLTATVHYTNDTARTGVGVPVMHDGDSVTDTATVNVDGRLLYTTDSGSIDANGLRTAFTDWKQGEIGSQLLRDTFAVWKQGSVVHKENSTPTTEHWDSDFSTTKIVGFLFEFL